MQKNGVHGVSLGVRETLGPALAAPRPLTRVQGRGSARSPRAGGIPGSWMEGSRTRNLTPSSSLGIQVALTNEFSYRKCIDNTNPFPAVWPSWLTMLPYTEVTS